ncbi:uncharacterized protein ACIGJ3_006832 [Trichechus inunguis]
MTQQQLWLLHQTPIQKQKRKNEWLSLAVPVAWGGLEASFSRAEETFLTTGTLFTFTKSQVYIFVFLFQILTASASTTYWAHVINPPVFHPVTWEEPEPPLSSNDTSVTGGQYLAYFKPLINSSEEGWFVLSTNWILYADALPLCFTTQPHTTSVCVPILEQWYMNHIYYNDTYRISAYSKQIFIKAIGVNGTFNNNSAFITHSPPSIPVCQHPQLSLTDPIDNTWVTYRTTNFSSYSLPFNISLENWGPHGLILLPNLSTWQWATPYHYLGHSQSWNPGLAGPILRLRYPVVIRCLYSLRASHRQQKSAFLAWTIRYQLHK